LRLVADWLFLRRMFFGLMTVVRFFVYTPSINRANWSLD
jgi:hypothetical protein